MTLTVTPIRRDFGAEVRCAAPLHALDAATFAEIRAAFDAHSVLVFRDQPLDDDTQVAFSEMFGPLERTVSSNPASGTAFARQSNLDTDTGEIIDAGDARMAYQKGNMLWHADSTFKKVPALASLLSARVVPDEGGDTELVSTRAAYENLPAAMKAELEALEVEHDFVFSRRQSGFKLPPHVAAANPPVRHPLVRTNPVTGRKSLMIGAHAKSIVGWAEADGRRLLDDLLTRATVPEAIYAHQWRDGDAILWDNRATLHRATPFDNTRHKRLMQRTTISDPDYASMT